MGHATTKPYLKFGHMPATAPAGGAMLGLFRVVVPPSGYQEPCLWAQAGRHTKSVLCAHQTSANTCHRCSVGAVGGVAAGAGVHKAPRAHALRLGLAGCLLSG